MKPLFDMKEVIEASKNLDTDERGSSEEYSQTILKEMGYSICRWYQKYRK